MRRFILASFCKRMAKRGCEQQVVSAMTHFPTHLPFQKLDMTYGYRREGGLPTDGYHGYAREERELFSQSPLKWMLHPF
ncbi:hypothetical protein TNCT_679141 [Trichonephila clavata]|uniref:Uncharacterized protein n=1 Tax=Trichonephila clavata TaxID=2740835 RepID=A0A8X6FHQ8_TRICU|nr:hypothetical protein TNCT_679141 [Trichonephila clavata]